MTTVTNILSIDVGQARVGVAVANTIARIASPLQTLTNDAGVYDTLGKLVEEHRATTLVVGWPRNLSGNETEQTQYVAKFIDELRSRLDVTVVTQDEAATSLKAEAELTARGKQYAKGDVDGLSAVYILEDYLQEGVH